MLASRGLPAAGDGAPGGWVSPEAPRLVGRSGWSVKKHLNTLYVLTQGAYVAKENETLVVRVDDQVGIRLPILTLQGLVCFGQVSVSPWAMAFCAERGVGVSFLSEHGRFLARVMGPTTGNVLLRREQYRRADETEGSMGIARPIVAAKVANARTVLQRAARDRPSGDGSEALGEAVRRLAIHLRDAERARDLETLRGIEGMAARTYFDVFDHLISQQKEAFRFEERSRRPPLDRVNALLSFIYTLLVHDIQSALESVGLDPAVGFLHRDRPGRPSLALDLMEELRSWFADRLVLSLINLRQLSANDFRQTETGAVLLSNDGRKTVLAAYQKRKQEELVHPFLDERTTIGLLPHLQALLLGRYLRGDLNGYPPFIWK
jgi:CRISPR-associated protein Cas1